MASWYRRFVPQFATVSEPLTRLLRKSKRWEWGDEQNTAFEALRENLATAPVLSCPNFEIPFVLQTDASTVGLGAVLTQTIDGIERVIAYASRVLADAEKKYSTTELECLAVVWSIKKFRAYLEGYRFTVVTDHSSLRWLHNLSNPTGRLARWALELLEYDYEIIHRKGALHHVPDALSRISEGREIPVTAVVVTKNLENQLANTADVWYRKRFGEVVADPKRFHSWRVVDDHLYFLRPNKVVSELVEDLDRWKLVVPKEIRKEALEEAHDHVSAGHLGVDKTYHRLAVTYYWPKMFRDVVAHVRRCDVCQRTKVEQRAPVGFMGKRVIERPWMVVAADVMGPLPRSKAGYSYLLVVQDLFSKWVECRALRSANGKLIREAIDELIISRWGAPRVLLTDNGTEFVNKTLKDFAKENNIEHTTVPPYHPQANPVERVNRILKTMIVAFLDRDHREWDRHLHDFRFAYNTAYHTSIGTSPAFLNLGRELEPANALRRRCEGPVEIGRGDPKEWSDRQKKLVPLLEWVTEHLEQAYDRQASQYNLRRRPNTFRVGDLVLKRQHVLSSAAQHIAAKLMPKFHGPFRIIKMLSTVVCELAQLDGGGMGKVHVQDLRPYVPPDSSQGYRHDRNPEEVGELPTEPSQPLPANPAGRSRVLDGGVRFVGDASPGDRHHHGGGGAGVSIDPGSVHPDRGGERAAAYGGTGHSDVHPEGTRRSGRDRYPDHGGLGPPRPADVGSGIRTRSSYRYRGKRVGKSGGVGLREPTSLEADGRLGESRVSTSAKRVLELLEPAPPLQ